MAAPCWHIQGPINCQGHYYMLKHTLILFIPHGISQMFNISPVLDLPVVVDSFFLGSGLSYVSTQLQT